MAITTEKIMHLLPIGTYQQCCRFNTFQYRGFLMTRRFINLHPQFDWKRHIEYTFEECMKPMTDRMMRVI